MRLNQPPADHQPETGPAVLGALSRRFPRADAGMAAEEVRQPRRRDARAPVDDRDLDLLAVAPRLQARSAALAFSPQDAQMLLPGAGGRLPHLTHRPRSLRSATRRW